MKTHVTTTAWLTDTAEFRVRPLDGGGHLVWIGDESDTDNKITLMFTTVGAIEPTHNLCRLRDAIDAYLIALAEEPAPAPPAPPPEPEAAWTLGRTSPPPPAEPASPADGHGEQE